MAHTSPRQDPYHAYHAYHALFPARRRWLFGTRPPLVRIVRLVRVFSGALPIDFRLRQTLLSLLSLFAHFFAARRTYPHLLSVLKEKANNSPG